MGKMHKSEKFYDNFHSSVQILVKIIINFSYFSAFPICVIFIKLDVHYSKAYFLCFIHLKKSDFSYKLGICDFGPKLGKLAIEIIDDHYINWNNAKI